MKEYKPGYYMAASVCLFTLLAYLTSLRNGFVLWDDDVYVYANYHIRSFDSSFLTWAFTTFYASNWHPLTWISHALDYAIWGLNPPGHHLTNIILHAANTFLVVVLAVRLLASRQADKLTSQQPDTLTGSQDSRFTLIAAGVTGLLFGIHPIHVESVAWVSERKDLLCALFYLLSILMYIKGRLAAMGNGQPAKDEIKTKVPIAYRLSPIACHSLAFGFFILALLSKPMAVSLPVVLLILDWYPFERIRSVRTFLNAFIEKLPFIALSIGLSVLTLLVQKSGGTMEMMEVVPLYARVLVAVKAVAAYLGKMLAPVDLSPYYAYPIPEEVTLLSMNFFVPVFIVAGITAVSLVALKRSKVLPALWGYYVITLVPVLGLVQVGTQAMADRYAYIPGIGPFLGVGLAVAWTWRKYAGTRRGLAYKIAAVAAGILIVASLSYRTVMQIGLWKDSITLWSYVIEKEPERMPLAYNNRGLVFMYNGELKKAMEDFDKAISLNPLIDLAHNNRGLVLMALNQPDKAIDSFNEALSITPVYYDAYVNRGLAFMALGQPLKAIDDYNMAVALKPSDGDIYCRRGNLYIAIGMKELGVADFRKACDLGSPEGCRLLNPTNAFK